MRGTHKARRVLTASMAGLLLISGVALARAAAPIPAAAAPASGLQRDATLDEYRAHLQELSAVVEKCAQARDTKNCDASLVGADDRVAANAGERVIGYAWLRALLDRAQLTDAPAAAQGSKSNAGAKTDSGEGESRDEESARPLPPTTSQLLTAAQARLQQDLAQAQTAIQTPAAHPQERAAMQKVLSERAFSGIEEQTVRESMLEKFGNWLNAIFENLSKLHVQAAWVGRVIYWGFIVAVCVALAWGLLQLERRWRIRLVPESSAPGVGAASAREWQLWLEDARREAAVGRWREAVHFVYWAAISRLESKRLWPADRARTPREYLALVAAEDPRRKGLAALTASFERIWYGGRAAGESDYRSAEQLATGLIAGGGAATGEVAEGGAR